MWLSKLKKDVKSDKTKTSYISLNSFFVEWCKEKQLEMPEKEDFALFIKEYREGWNSSSGQRSLATTQ